MKRYPIRPGRAVRPSDLQRLQTTQDTHFLLCRKCHGTYSADHADYSAALRPRDEPLKCCGLNNWLMTRGSCP